MTLSFAQALYHQTLQGLVLTSCILYCDLL